MSDSCQEDKMDALANAIASMKTEATERSEQLKKLTNVIVGENGDGGLLQEVREMRTYVKIASWIFGIIAGAFILNVATTIIELKNKS